MKAASLYEQNLYHQLGLVPPLCKPSIAFEIYNLIVHVWNITLMCIIAMSVGTEAMNAG